MKGACRREGLKCCFSFIRGHLPQVCVCVCACMCVCVCVCARARVCVQVRLYISCGHQEMWSERALLNRYVLPALAVRCLDLRLRLHWFDLSEYGLYTPPTALSTLDSIASTSLNTLGSLLPPFSLQSVPLALRCLDLAPRLPDRPFSIWPPPTYVTSRSPPTCLTLHSPPTCLTLRSLPTCLTLQSPPTRPPPAW